MSVGSCHVGMDRQIFTDQADNMDRTPSLADHRMSRLSMLKCIHAALLTDCASDDSNISFDGSVAGMSVEKLARPDFRSKEISAHFNMHLLSTYTGSLH